MEEEIIAVFKKNGFSLDEEEEIAKKCKFSHLPPKILLRYFVQ